MAAYNDPGVNNYPGTSPQDPRDPRTTPPTGATRYNTTPNWQDPYNPPSPGDPYWAEWIAANPGYTPPGTWPGSTITGPGAPPPGGTGGSGSGSPFGSFGTGITSPFTGTFTPPTPTAIGSFVPPTFHQPTPEDAAKDPGYKFTFDQGENSLQNWAAARGTLNDSGTAKALIDYGQAAAGQQYKSVWDRDFSQYQTGQLNPALLNFSTQAANTSHLNDVANTNSWNDFLQRWNIFRDQRDSTFNKNLQLASA